MSGWWQYNGAFLMAMAEVLCRFNLKRSMALMCVLNTYGLSHFKVPNPVKAEGAGPRRCESSRLVQKAPVQAKADGEGVSR